MSPIGLTLIGSLVMGLPALVVAWFAFRRQRPIFFFAVALILVGLGYLATTNAPTGIALAILGAKS